MPHAFLALAVVLVAPVQEPALRFDRLTPGELEPFVQGILDSATRSLERLLATPGPRTLASLRAYDDFRIAVNRARVVSLLSDVHPDSAIRAAAARAEDRLVAFNDARRTDRRIYDLLAAVDTATVDAEVRHWLRRELEVFRQGGMNREAAVRDRAAALERELARLRRVWEENPRREAATVAFDSADLDGMPADWLRARDREPNGTLLVTNDEMRNIMAQATNPATRERALVVYLRLRPNHFVLDSLLRTRHELATLLGYRNWAERQLRRTMAGSAQRVRAFLDEVRRQTEPALRRAIAARAPPGATSIGLQDLLYRPPTGAAAAPGELAALRPYLPYTRVRDGMLDLAREFLSLEFRPAPDLPVWHPTVEPYRVFEDGRLVALVYLDVHWRPGKSVQGASASTFQLGVRDRAITEAAILGGLVRARPGEPALLGLREMSTLFHEFGHLLQTLCSTRTWFATSGLPEEFDFREVPAALFEAWAADPAVVARFARHYQTGAPPPQEILDLVRPGPSEGSLLAQWFSRMSLELHDRPPGDVHAIVRETFAQTLPPGLPVGIHLPEGDIHAEVTFPHLGTGYDALYYTYLWSAVISKDCSRASTAGCSIPRPSAPTAHRSSSPAGRSRWPS